MKQLLFKTRHKRVYSIAMRIKTFLLILFVIVSTSLFLLILGPAGQQNDSLKNIVSQTHQQIQNLQKNLRSVNEKNFEVDPAYLAQLGFTQSIYNISKLNFCIVTYTLNGEIASTILHAQNVAQRLPNEILLIYDLGLSENELHQLTAFCNHSKCQVITYDLSTLPTHLKDETMHAFRPIIIHDALLRSKSILFMENNIRLRGSAKEVAELRTKIEKGSSGVMGWVTRQAVSTRTHPKMFEYFQTAADSFYFLPMVSLDFVFFASTNFINEKIMLPWIKCSLTFECIHPIGAQAGGCKFNKKPLYRYSGCHGFDVSAFNIVLGVQFDFDEMKYSIRNDNNINGDDMGLYYVETLEQATKILENRRKNISDTSEKISEYPYTEV